MGDHGGSGYRESYHESQYRTGASYYGDGYADDDAGPSYADTVSRAFLSDPLS